MIDPKAIAIVGLGSILPDAPDTQAFWENIQNGRSSIREVPGNRWKWEKYYDPDPASTDKTYSKIGGWVTQYDFEPMRWGIPIPPSVLTVMDEGQKWAIAAARQALQHYGYPQRAFDPARTAVILGNALAGENHYRTTIRIHLPDYIEVLQAIPDFQNLPAVVQDALLAGMTRGIRALTPEITEDTMPGELSNVIAGRVANVFNFSGPNFVTDAACASSMAALQSAVEGLISHRFDAVLTGGVDHNMGPEGFVKFCKIGALSPDGSRPFAEGANGFVMGEGTAIFLLKRLVDAERDGDDIQAVIRGIGSSSDGKGKGITAPNPLGQQRAIERAWKDAGLMPSSVTLIEGHGTSTRVGDVAEVNSLAAAFAGLEAPVASIALGSVKSNFGHLKAAAGAAGLLKATLALRDKVLPPSINYERPNPAISFDQLPFYVNTEKRDWPQPENGPRRAAISSFGFGGTNFHVVMEEYLPGVLTTERAVYPAAMPASAAAVPEGEAPLPVEAACRATAQPASLPARAEIQARILGLVSEKTGYPTEMLDLDLDMEADLGVDTVKQAELFATVRELYSIPRREDLRLSDYNTLAKVVDLVEQSLAAKVAPVESVDQPAAESAAMITQTLVAPAAAEPPQPTLPERPSLFLSADTAPALREQMLRAAQAAAAGQVPAARIPSPTELAQPERLAVDYETPAELHKKLEKALKVLENDTPATRQALTAQGIYRGSGQPGKVAFLFPGQGSQYANMLAELRSLSPVVAETFREADEVMTPILGRPLTSLIFVPEDKESVARAEDALRDTAITQPAVLTADVAMLRLLATYGYRPDIVMGHSLGEYAALVAAGALSFPAALQIVSARGREMTRVSVADNGAMAAVSAPIAEVERILKGIPGYVVIANINSPLQSVIGGATAAVEQAVQACLDAGFQAVRIPVSHAFHTAIVAPASGPLRAIIARLGVQPPQIPVIANVTGQAYPTDPEQILDMLANQVASPVQFIQGMQALYAAGARVLVESGPKRVLSALATDNLKDKSDVMVLSTNHPRKGALPSLNEALCGLWAAGVMPAGTEERTAGQKKQVLPEDMAAHDTDRAGWEPAPTEMPAAVVATQKELPGREEIQARILGLVSEKTGYPTEMLDLDLDMEADLGVDTVKQAELFATVRELYGIPRREDLRLSDYSTLAKVIDFVEQSLDAKAAPIEPAFQPVAASATPPTLAPATPVPAQPAVVLGEYTAVNIPTVRPPLSQPTRVSFEPEFVLATCGLTARSALATSSVAQPARLTGSVVISGAGLGLPGTGHAVFEDDNVQRILSGQNMIDPLREETRETLLEKRITRLNKSDAGATMDIITDLERTIKLAGQRGEFDLAQDFGVPQERIEATDIATQLAIAAGVEALRDAGIPLVMRYRRTSLGSLLPDRWMLPEALADETGVIFGSAFPGLGRMAEETDRFYQHQNLLGQLETLRELRGLPGNASPALAEALDARIRALEEQLAALDYHFDRRFIFRILNMGHSQFAEYIGARGPNTAVNAACATTTHAVALAEDWIRSGRARRVVVVAGDDVTSGRLMDWIGAGLLASGATTTEGNLRLAALPFDRRRNGMIMGMGAAALVVEAEDAVRERGMRGIAEVLSAQVANSAFHGTRLDVCHVREVMDRLVSQAEERFGIRREDIAPKTVFLSHETYTPARGGSAAAEIHALRHTFGAAANRVVIANTKGFTGHTMGVGIEDVVAVKALETGIVPPVAHLDGQFEPDPDLGDLNLSRGGEYPVQYALRLGAGFGSQIAMTLLRKIPNTGERVHQPTYQKWLAAAAGYASADLEVTQRTLRVRHQGAPTLTPARSTWAYGSGPTLFADAPEDGPAPALSLAPATAAESVADAAAMEGTQPAVVSDILTEVPTHDEIQARILSLVSEKTGYPAEMLDLDLDLEADLGIDTVKQAELFVNVRETYGIPRREDLRLSDYNTLSKVIGFVEQSLKPQPAPEPEKPDVQPVAERSAQTVQATPTPATAQPPQVVERKVPVAVLRPRLELCKPTGAQLEGARVVVVHDRGGAGDALASVLAARGARVLALRDTMPEAAAAQTQTWLAEGPLQGVYHLSALDIELPLEQMDEHSWQAANDARVGVLYTVMHAITAMGGSPFLVSATRLGGLHAVTGDVPAPLGGAVTGFTKAYAAERPRTLVKSVDFTRDAAPGTIAARLVDETLRDPGMVEIGWEGEQRFTISLMAAPLDEASADFTNPVTLITGGTGGIAAPILLDLARHLGGSYYLTSRSPLPAEDHPDFALLSDRDALRRALAARLQASGEKATPARVEAQIEALERAAGAQRLLRDLRALGCRAEYAACDVTSAEALNTLAGRIASEEGRLDLVLHAAGVDHSKMLENKEPADFARVYAAKATGFFHLLRAVMALPQPPRAVVAFSSVAARFGNAGQTDYAAANDLLDKCCAALNDRLPRTRFLALDWGAWAEVGMASRGSLPQIMQRAGIEMLSPESAAPLLRQELLADTRGEAVLAGALGMLSRPRDRDGGLDLERANRALVEGEPAHVMLSHLAGFDLYRGIVLEAELDPAAEPFLKDHALNGIPVLPGVMGIEGFSVAAQHVASVLGASNAGFHVARLEGVRFLGPFKFYRGEPRRITWYAQVLRQPDGLCAHVTLESTLALKARPAEPVQHFTGKVYLKPVSAPETRPTVVEPPHWNGAYTLKREEVYKLYFHGPAFQVLEAVQRNGRTVLGRLSTDMPPTTSTGQALISAPLLIELCLQTAGVYEIGKTGVLALPQSIGEVRLYGQPAAGSDLFAQVTPGRNADDSLCFDARVLDSHGRLYLELKDYTTSPLPYPVEEELRRPLRRLVEDERGG